MNRVPQEQLTSGRRATVDSFAQQLVDHPEQMAVYDYAKWNLLGHANREMRFLGHHPWPKRRDHDGSERTLSVPVFSGFSAETESLIVVRKDPWTPAKDPDSWLVAEQHIPTGAYTEEKILSVSVDAWRQLWLQLAPPMYSNWPPGRHPSLFTPRYDQMRIQATLDEQFHTDQISFVARHQAKPQEYQDLEYLEHAIVAAQRERAYADEQVRLERQRTLNLLGERGVVYAEAV